MKRGDAWDRVKAMSDIGPLSKEELLEAIKNEGNKVLKESINQRIQNREFALLNIDVWKGYVKRTEEEIKVLMDGLLKRNAP